MSQTIDQVYRDYNTQGIPASGEHEPDKREIRALLKMIQNSGGQAVTRNTLSALNGVTPPNEDYMGVVLTGADAGYYYRSGGAWVFGRAFPDTFAVMTVTGGTANAIVAGIDPALNPSTVRLFALVPAADNTGPVTINGTALVGFDGQPLEPGFVRAGAMIVFALVGGSYRLLVDHRFQQFAEQVEGWRDETEGFRDEAEADANRAHDEADRSEAARDIAAGYASDAVSQGNVPIYATAVGMPALEVPVGINAVEVNGQAAAGDGLGGKAIDTDNGTGVWFVSGGATARNWYRAKDVSTSQRVVYDRIVDAPVLVQRKLMEPFFGFNNGITDTQIYANAQFAPQGLAYWKGPDGKEYVFMNQQVAGTAWAADEKNRIVQYELKEDGSVGAPVTFTGPLSSIHSHLSALEEGGKLYLYSSAPTVSGGSTTDGSSKGWAKIEWKGAATTDADVQVFRVFGQPGSGHRYSQYGKSCVQASTDGRYVVMLPVDYSGNASGRTYFLYDRVAVEAMADPLIAEPLHTPIPLKPLATNGDTALQGEACNGDFTAVLYGAGAPFERRGVSLIDIKGNLVGSFYIDGSRGQYTTAELMDHPTLGFPASFEPEGIAWRGSELLINFIDQWRTSTDIVTWNGKNWASIATGNQGNLPSSAVHWVETLKPATSGAWNEATTYGAGNYTRRSKVLYSIRVPKGEVGEQPLSTTYSYQPGIADLNAANSFNIQAAIYKWLDTFRISAFVPAIGKYLRSLEIRDGNRLMLFDTRYGSDNDAGVEMVNNNGEQRFDAASGFRWRIGTSTKQTILDGNSLDWQIRRPSSDLAFNFGTSVHRWLTGYFGSLEVGTTGNAGFDASGGLRVQSVSMAELLDATHAVNTTNKFAGKIVFDNTNIRLLVSAGGGATSTWRVCDNSASFTPI